MLENLVFDHITPDYNVNTRLSKLMNWQREYQQERDRINQELSNIDLTTKNGRHTADRLCSILDRISLLQIKEPFTIKERDFENVNVGTFMTNIRKQYSNMDVSMRDLWLNNMLFIFTPKLREINKVLLGLVNERGTQHRGLLLSGDSRCGKTTYLHYLWCQFMPYPSPNCNVVPIVIGEVPESPTSRQITRSLVSEYGQVYSGGDTDEDLAVKLRVYSKRCLTRIAALDEAENIHTYVVRRKLINTWNQSKHLVMISATCNPQQFLGDEPQMRERWNVNCELSLLNDMELRSLLLFLELLVPLPQPSQLYSLYNAKLIAEYAEYKPAKVVNIVTKATNICLERGNSSITQEILLEACHFVSPHVNKVKTLKLAKKAVEALKKEVKPQGDSNDSSSENGTPDESPAVAEDSACDRENGGTSNGNTSQ